MLCKCYFKKNQLLSLAINQNMYTYKKFIKILLCVSIYTDTFCNNL